MGVPVYFGELLSEQAEASLELGEMGSLLSATSNDAYNALVCAHYAPEMGRQRVFQLATDEVAEHRRPMPAARGLTAFADGVQFEDLERHCYSGWTFQRTNITEDFVQEAFLAGLPEGALPLMVVSAKGAVSLVGEDGSLKAQAGDRVVWFGCKSACTQRASEEFVATSERSLV